MAKSPTRGGRKYPTVGAALSGAGSTLMGLIKAPFQMAATAANSAEDGFNSLFQPRRPLRDPYRHLRQKLEQGAQARLQARASSPAAPPAAAPAPAFMPPVPTSPVDMTGASPIPPRPQPDPQFTQYTLKDGSMWTPGTPILPPLQGQPRPPSPEDFPDPVGDQIRLSEQRMGARQALHQRNLRQIGMGMPPPPAGDMSIGPTGISQADQARANQIRADGRLAFGGLDDFTRRWRRIGALQQQGQGEMPVGQPGGVPRTPANAPVIGTRDPDERIRNIVQKQLEQDPDNPELQQILAWHQPGDGNWRNSAEGRQAHLAMIRNREYAPNPSGPDLDSPVRYGPGGVPLGPDEPGGRTQRDMFDQNMRSAARQRGKLMDAISAGRDHRVAAARSNFLRRNPVFTLGGDTGRLAALAALGMDAGSAGRFVSDSDRNAIYQARDQQQLQQQQQMQDFALSPAGQALALARASGDPEIINQTINRILGLDIDTRLEPEDPNAPGVQQDDLLRLPRPGVRASPPLRKVLH